ncbi:cortex morphogenetic protein CmpA [Risungbinella massiliensis]|uniref:cortex morphogenetic protein CmpA n=1 Tax=Risungbinella massiliensis TaxID=1329796 RepID=UPI0011C72C53|nr:cortex morphogenetic protein CmpA [Risungbinella massiliensis]
MPNWLQKQLMQAYHSKDRYQILFLNRCWFQFCNKERSKPSFDGDISFNRNHPTV